MSTDGAVDTRIEVLRRRIEAVRAQADDGSLLDAAATIMLAVRGGDEGDAHARTHADATALADRLDALASEAPAPTAVGLRARTDALCTWLRERCGFGGSRVHYHEEANSLLDEVLDRRQGIPITLAIVWIEIAGRLGLRGVGVNFPGHFLVRVSDPAGEGEDGDLLVDPFEMRIVEREALAARLRRFHGASAVLTEEHLRMATPLMVLLRMLNNLKQLAMGEQRWRDALRFCDLILLAEPRLMFEHGDRALCLERLGEPEQALRALQVLDGGLGDGPVRMRLEAEMLRLSRLLQGNHRIH